MNEKEKKSPTADENFLSKNKNMNFPTNIVKDSIETTKTKRNADFLDFPLQITQTNKKETNIRNQTSDYENTNDQKIKKREEECKILRFCP